MNLKEKIKSYSFWVSLTSAIILILKILGNRFGFVVDESMISDLFTALCSILVLMGIIVVPTTNIKNCDLSSKTEIQSDINITCENNQSSNSKQIEIPKFVNIVDNQANLNQNENVVESTDDNSILQNIENKQDKSINNTPQETSNNPNYYTSNNLINDIEETDTITNFNESIDNSNISSTEKLKSILNNERENFKDNLNAYIFELQEEIRKTRENM